MTQRNRVKASRANKNVLKGKLSEKVSEYHFNESAYEENGAQSGISIHIQYFPSKKKAPNQL